MQLQEILYSQGFGTRRVCSGLVEQGWVALGEPAQICRDPWLECEPEGLVFWVQGQRWTHQRLAYLMLHKPAGYECSQKPGAWPSVYSLLPSPLRQRPGGAASGVQAVGRLDQDTTGLLLLSDDGAFIHRMASPRHHVPKLYQVGCEQPVDAAMVQRLLEGVMLEGEQRPVRAAACTRTGSHTLDLTLTEGKYHQVKRMLVAVGNRVCSLHRSRIGALELPPDLAPGAWRWLTPPQVQALQAKNPSAAPVPVTSAGSS